MFNSDDFVKIGNVAVDSGTVMFVDPCYVLNEIKREGKPNECDYKDMLDAFDVKGHSSHVEPWGNDFGIIVPTTHGDGLYGVYGIMNQHGQVRGVFVDFDNLLDTEDEEEYDDYEDEDEFEEELDS